MINLVKCVYILELHTIDRASQVVMTANFGTCKVLTRALYSKVQIIQSCEA